MKRPLHLIVLFTLTLLSAPLIMHAQTATCIGLVLKIDSTDNVLMPRITEIILSTPAQAEPDIKVGMYVLKVNEVYCRNAPLSTIVHQINGVDSEGLPVWLSISDSKDEFPKHRHVLKRGKPCSP